MEFNKELIDVQVLIENQQNSYNTPLNYPLRIKSNIHFAKKKQAIHLVAAARITSFFYPIQDTVVPPYLGPMVFFLET